MIWSKGSPVQAMFQYGGKVRSQWRSVTDPQKCLNKAIRHLHSFSRLLNIPTAALPVGPSIQKAFSETIASSYFSQTPMIIRNYPVPTERWSDRAYLLDRVGSDLHCDVEMGHYNQAEKLNITFGMYLQYLQQCSESHGDTSNIPVDQLLYLAQNDLPQGLIPDISVPDLCKDSKIGLGEGHLYQTMLWMGPKGSISPLHFDPLHNFLIQVCGRKRVMLIDRNQSVETLYSGKMFGQQSNTSAVDLENPDYKQYPLFTEVSPVYKGEIGPGDVLFIPSKWWHHVRSLDFSISVNAWWR